MYAYNLITLYEACRKSDFAAQGVKLSGIPFRVKDCRRTVLRRTLYMAGAEGARR